MKSYDKKNEVYVNVKKLVKFIYNCNIFHGGSKINKECGLTTPLQVSTGPTLCNIKLNPIKSAKLGYKIPCITPFLIKKNKWCMLQN